MYVDRETRQRRRHHLHESVIQRSVRSAVRAAGITKPASCHTLRHSFASHLLESGIDVVSIQRLLGHAKVETTAHYLHVTPQSVGKRASPLDLLRLTPVSPV